MTSFVSIPLDARQFDSMMEECETSDIEFV